MIQYILDNFWLIATICVLFIGIGMWFWADLWKKRFKENEKEQK